MALESGTCADSFTVDDRTSRIFPSVPSIVRRCFVHIDVCNTAGAIGMDLTSRRGVAGSNTSIVDNPCVDASENNYGFYFREADYGLVSGNIADLVNEEAEDIGFYFDYDTSDFLGSDNIAVAAGTDIEDDSTSSDVEVEEGSPPPAVGSLVSWGYNNAGQLGHGDTANRSTPHQVGTSTSWQWALGGAGGGCILDVSANLFTMGDNTYGQLGHGDIASRSTPHQIGSHGSWSQVTHGNSHILGIDSSGRLFAWGRNYVGNLGQGAGAASAYSTPTQVGALTNWSHVQAHPGPFSDGWTTVAVKTDGTLWVWGETRYGRVGNNTASNFTNSPIQVDSGTSWSLACEGHILNGLNLHACFALKTDGTLWNWGPLFPKPTGHDIWSSTPVQIGSATTWTKIDSGFGCSVGIRSDGTLWSWGAGTTYGEHGQGDIGFYSSPTQVGAATDWADAFMGLYHMVAIKTTGAIYSCGRNDFGQLGHGDTTNRSTPHQVGALTSWGTLNAGGHTGFARAT